MAHQSPEFEQQDVLGKTRHFNGSVGTSSVLVPVAPLGKITRAYIKNDISNSFFQTLKVALDGNTDYVTLQQGEYIEWGPKNNASGTPIQQIRIEGSSANTNYEIIMDFEP